MKIKKNINLFKKNKLTERRLEIQNEMMINDTNLPESLLHDDLDGGMLKYVKDNFIIISEGKEIPIFPKIMTLQRWGEMLTTLMNTDENNNVQVPFIGLIRKPDVQPGTNHNLIKNIPNRRKFKYKVNKTFENGVVGAEIYSIPAPIAVDISYSLVIASYKIREINLFNKKVMQLFDSRQSYSLIKGYYVPIILDDIDDNSNDDIESRKYYLQTYSLTMLGYLIDSDEFEVKPAISYASINLTLEDDEQNTKLEDSFIKHTIITNSTLKNIFISNNNKKLLLVIKNGTVLTKNSDYSYIDKSSYFNLFDDLNIDDELLFFYYDDSLVKFKNEDNNEYTLKSVLLNPELDNVYTIEDEYFIPLCVISNDEIIMDYDIEVIDNFKFELKSTPQGSISTGFMFYYLK
jgi:hypothetical protein